ncbi:MAG: iron donor protein CyaY [Minicystis sp.]
MNDEALTEQEFEKLADLELHDLERALDAQDGLEVDLSSGILTLEFPDGLKYVVNSHRAARQIWMAAERSAWHFDFVRSSARWVAPKNGDELRSTLEGVVSRKVGAPVQLGVKAG